MSLGGISPQFDELAKSEDKTPNFPNFSYRALSAILAAFMANTLSKPIWQTRVKSSANG